MMQYDPDQEHMREKLFQINHLLRGAIFDNNRHDLRSLPGALKALKEAVDGANCFMENWRASVEG